MPTNDPGHPVLVVAPVGNDAGALKDLLTRDGIHACVCDDLNHCAPVIKSTNVAVLVLTEEALVRDHLPSLLQALKAQPEWSELPVIVLAGEGESRRGALLELTAAAPGAVAVLERPLQMATVLATVKVALRSRRRQYQVRDLLEDQQRSMLERQQRAEQLQQALDQRATEVTIAQQGLAAAQRMAAVGTLASGLAHDLSNVLMPLSARVDAVLADARLTGEHRTDLNVVVALIDHLRQMARNLSLFSRDPDQEGIEGFTILPNWLNRVRNLIEASVTEKHRRGQRIRLQWEIADDLPPVGIAPHRLTQTILNLVQNARDAILMKQPEQQEQNTGTITVRARAAPNASTVIISVIDDGMGMTDDVKRRCIEPFYTTKDRPSTVGEGPSISSGSGMGLALAHGIAQRIGGELRIHSQFGQGTTVEVHAPIVAPPATPKASPAPSISRRSPASAASTEHDSGIGDAGTVHVPARSTALPHQRSA